MHENEKIGKKGKSEYHKRHDKFVMFKHVA